MNKIVGFDIGENSVKMAYFVGRELKRTAKVELPGALFIVDPRKVCTP